MTPTGAPEHRADLPTAVHSVAVPSDIALHGTSINVEVFERHDGTLPDIEYEWTECLKSAPGHQQLFGYHWFAGWLRHLDRDDD
jgi:hypothetical protein